MDERIKKIADYYGYESQREQFIEECAEMIQASQKCKRTDIQNAQQYRERFDNFQEEVADVLIMAQQLRYLLGARDIDDIIDKKLDRQIQRIKDESETDVIYQDDKIRAIKVTGWENDKYDNWKRRAENDD